jgi:hypothetical protein
MSDYKAQQAARDVCVNALRAANPNLVGGYGCVVAAKNIRKELKAAFPGVKFSVVSEKYAGGNSINVRYEDGPAVAEVEAIANKYAVGNFDGMTDCYNYEASYWADAFGGSKFIFVGRDFSDESVAAGIAAVVEKFGNVNEPSVEDFRNGNARRGSPFGEGFGGQEWDILIYQALREMDLRNVQIK